jgi:hypothetical protein
MARRGKGTEGKTGDEVLDLRHKGVTRLGGIEAGVVVWRKMKTLSGGSVTSEAI